MLDENGNEIVEAPSGGTSPTENPVVPVETPPKDPKDGGVQKRINELSREKKEAREEAAYWRGKAETREVPVAQKTPTGQDRGQDLDPNDFDSDADYLKATAAQVRKEIKADADAEKNKEKLRTNQSAIHKQYQDARVKHPDFDEVALNSSIQITQSMFDAAMGNSLGDILYHLGKNSTEADRIAVLPLTQQIKEIGKIEARLVVTPTPQSTNTPNPPSTVGGGGGSPPVKKEGEMNRSELHTKWEADRRKAMGL